MDGIYGTRDRGAVPTILDLIQNTQFPIIMCSNEYKQALQPLYNKIKKFEVHRLSYEEMAKIAQTILKGENITNVKKKDLEPFIKELHQLEVREFHKHITDEVINKLRGV